LAFANLITTILIKESSICAIDTLMQRARWFGYRLPLIKYTNLCLTKKLKFYFEQITKFNNKVYEILNTSTNLISVAKQKILSELCKENYIKINFQNNRIYIGGEIDE
jgi:hypothetical protein